MPKIPKYKQISAVNVPGISTPCSLEQRFKLDCETSAIYDISSQLYLGKETVGTITGWVILKDQYRRGGFYEEMDSLDQELCDLAFGLFEDDGSIKKKIIEHPVQKGTGVWGRELDKGGMVVTYRWEIEPQYRHKGIGKWLLRKHFEIPHIYEQCSFAWVQPAYMELDKVNMTEEQFKAARNRITDTFRRMGYRRVGITSFLCLPLDNHKHPAATLAIENDAEKPEVDEKLEEPPLDMSLFANLPIPGFGLRAKKTADTALSREYPLHSSIINDEEPIALANIIAAYTADPSIITKADPQNALLIHVATHKAYLSIISYLISVGSPLDARTAQGNTPLEALEEIISGSREFMRFLQMPWNGLSEAEAKSLLLLRQHSGKPIPAARDGLEPWELLKYDCSCGQCIEGYLSRRMLFRIACAGAVSGDVLRMDADDARARQPMDSFAFEETIPPRIYPKGMYPSHAKGLAAIFMAIGELAEEGKKPSIEAIEAQIWQSSDLRYVEFFKQIGGTVEMALNAVLYRAWEEGPEGDNSFSAVYPEDEEDGRRFYDLPECNNDLAWGIVRQGLGTSYKPQTYRSVDAEDYEFDDSDDSMEEDSDY